MSIELDSLIQQNPQNFNLPDLTRMAKQLDDLHRLFFTSIKNTSEVNFREKFRFDILNQKPRKIKRTTVE